MTATPRRASAKRWRRSLPVFERFRAGFTGKASPVHFWWGSFDLAVTRFSGRDGAAASGRNAGPARPDHARSLQPRSLERAASGPAEPTAAEPFFYSYIYPEPRRLSRTATVAHGRFDETLGEFVLPYADVRRADDPGRDARRFLQSTYEAAADLAKWDRAALEREPVAP